MFESENLSLFFNTKDLCDLLFIINLNTFYSSSPSLIPDNNDDDDDDSKPVIKMMASTKEEKKSYSHLIFITCIGLPHRHKYIVGYSIIITHTHTHTM